MKPTMNDLRNDISALDLHCYRAINLCRVIGGDELNDTIQRLEGIRVLVDEALRQTPRQLISA